MDQENIQMLTSNLCQQQKIFRYGIMSSIQGIIYIAQLNQAPQGKLFYTPVYTNGMPIISSFKGLSNQLHSSNNKIYFQTKVYLVSLQNNKQLLYFKCHAQSNLKENSLQNSNQTNSLINEHMQIKRLLVQAMDDILVNFFTLNDQNTNFISRYCNYQLNKKKKFLQAKMRLSRDLRKIILQQKQQLVCEENIQQNRFQFENLSKKIGQKQSALPDCPSQIKKNLNSEHKTQEGNVKQNHGNIFILSSISTDETIATKKIQGGVSFIKKVLATRIYSQNQMEEVNNLGSRQLVKKTLRQLKKCPINCCEFDHQKQNRLNKNLQYRFEQQLKMVSHINKVGGPKDYLLNYYCLKKPEGTFVHNHFQTDKCYQQNSQIYQSESNYYYADYMEHNLEEFLKQNRQKLGYEQLIDMSIQIVEIFRDLHQCGVVHRDLKPHNVMVQECDGKIKLKLIDFSDSHLKEAKIETLKQDKYLHGTLPYSPLECQKFNETYKQCGINKQEIDYWSIGVLLYYIMNDTVPLSFSICYYHDINKLWKKQMLTQYCWTINNRNKFGINILKLVYEFLKIQLIQPKQELRLNLNKTVQILKATKKYFQKTLTILQQ